MLLESLNIPLSKVPVQEFEMLKNAKKKKKKIPTFCSCQPFIFFHVMPIKHHF